MTRPKTRDSAPSEKKSILADVAAFFTSVKTTMLVLCLLAVASILGTLVPQDVDLEQLRQTATPFSYRLVLILDLHSVFRSWWFILLLLLLSGNLLGCLISRLPRIPVEWKGTSNDPSFSFGVSDPRTQDQIVALLVPPLKRLLGASPVEIRGNSETTLSWTKHRVYLLAFPLMHVSIFFVLLGGLIGLMYGVKGYVQIKEGTTEGQFVATPSGQVTPLPFQIALDKFTLKRYPNGLPKEFRSDVRLMKDGKEVRKGSVLVNHPLTFEGISLFQSDYKLLAIKDVTLAVTGAEGKSSEIHLQPRQPVLIAGTPYSLGLVGLEPGTTEMGAWVEIDVQSEGKNPQSVTVYQKEVAPVEVGSIGIRFEGYEGFYSTGLQVAYDPGTNVVWIGCGLLILGFSLTLFTNLRRTRVSLTARGGKTLVQVSGRSRKGRAEFRKKVEGIVRETLQMGGDRSQEAQESISDGKSS